MDFPLFYRKAGDKSARRRAEGGTADGSTHSQADLVSLRLIFYFQ